MDSAALQLLETRLSRLKTDHVGNIIAAANAALEQFEPTRRATYTDSLAAYCKSASAELNAYCTLVGEEVLSLASQLLQPLSEEAKARVLEIASQAFDDSLYPNRFKLQETAMARKGQRYGQSTDTWGQRTDIEYSLHQVGTSNVIRQTVTKLADQLELVRLRSLREATASLPISGGMLMPFADLMNDTIDILRTDGTKHTGLKASVQRNKVFMDAGKVLVQPDDLIIRRMSNGGEETYRVIDPGFYEAFHGIKAHYQMEVQKLGLPEAKSAVQHITYNINGNNARINQNSVDNSTNVVHVDSRAIQYIDALRQELAQTQLSESGKATALEIVDEVEEAFRSGRPKKSVVSALLNSLPQAANIATIVASIFDLLK